MAQDPRHFLVKNCSADINSRIKKASQKKSFFNDARFLSGIEGTGDIGNGLRALVGTSDVIGGGGRGPLPDGSSDELGEDYVMDQVGINPRAARQNAPLNPGVVNRGVGAAGQVWDKVKQGQYSNISDLPQAAADLTNLKAFTDSIFTPSESNEQPDFVACQASPYAMDLIKRAPKYKFLFVVQFTFSEPYTSWASRTRDFAFVVKQSDRPDVQFEYDDVNMYNFKTKVIRKATYQPIGMRFYDDDTNEAMHFYNAYLRAVSPIANIGTVGEVEQYEENGMDFSTLGQSAALEEPTYRYSGSVGPLLNNAKTVLKEIKVYHVFGNGNQMNIYHFFNPKITELQLDELNMADNGDGNEVALQFSYDGLYVQPNQPVNPNINSESNLKDLTNGGNYPLRYVGSDSPSVTGNDKGDDATESEPTGFWESAKAGWNERVDDLGDRASNLSKKVQGFFD